MGPASAGPTPLFSRGRDVFNSPRVLDIPKDKSCYAPSPHYTRKWAILNEGRNGLLASFEVPAVFPGH